MLKKIFKPSVMSTIKNILLVLLGNLILAISVKLFQEQHNIVSGGVTGIGIIVSYLSGDFSPFNGIPFLQDISLVTLVVFIASLGLWILGLILLGKDFAIKTLLSTLIFPVFMAFFDVIPGFNDIALDIAGAEGGVLPPTNEIEVGRILLSGIFAGVGVGAGCSIAFLGGGSTGGVDTLAFIFEKYFKLKTSVCVFIIDGTIVLLGWLVIGNHIASLCGIITAFLGALMIEVIYASNQSCYVADIISDKWEEISHHIHTAFDRGTTIIEAKGGYKGERRVILRVVFDKRQFIDIKKYIHSIDPKAFITYTQTNAVFGEGFTSAKK